MAVHGVRGSGARTGCVYRDRAKIHGHHEERQCKAHHIIDAEVVFVRNEKRLSTNVESLYKPHQRRLFCFGNTETQVVGYRGSNPQSIIESSRSPSGAV